MTDMPLTDDRAVHKRENFATYLVSVPHFFSHFYLLTLAPMFLVIKDDLNVSFTELGLVITLYALGSASGQYPAGILSDKIGPRWVLITGVGTMSMSFFLMGFATEYWHLLALAIFGGLGDSVVHPANFTVITAQVRPKRLGWAYSIHAFAGFFGCAAAPPIIDMLRTATDWHMALHVAGAAGLITTAALFYNKHWLIAETVEPNADGSAAQPVGMFTLLKSGPILLLLMFYISMALAGQGIQSFSPSALPVLYEITVSEANRTLFVYLLGISLGVLAGGWVADKFGRFDLIATVGYFTAAILIVVIAFAWLPIVLMVIAFFIAGFMMGIVFPSRDLMVREVAPKGAAGKAFGFVNSGFGYGGMIGPPLFGAIMDAGNVQAVYFTSAGVILIIIASAIGSTFLARRQGPVEAPAPAE